MTSTTDGDRGRNTTRYFRTVSAAQRDIRPAKNDSVIKLLEVFPNWSEEDLIMALSEVDGDLELTIHRITAGHILPWSEQGKKTVKRGEVMASNHNSVAYDEHRREPMRAAPQRQHGKIVGEGNKNRSSQVYHKKNSANQGIVHSTSPQLTSTGFAKHKDKLKVNLENEGVNISTPSITSPYYSSKLSWADQEVESPLPVLSIAEQKLEISRPDTPQSLAALPFDGPFSTESKSCSSEYFNNEPRRIQYRTSRGSLKKSVSLVESQENNEPSKSHETSSPPDLFQAPESFSPAPPLPAVEIPKGLSSKLSNTFLMQPVVVMPLRATVRPGLSVTFGVQHQMSSNIASSPFNHSSSSPYSADCTSSRSFEDLIVETDRQDPPYRTMGVEATIDSLNNASSNEHCSSKRSLPIQRPGSLRDAFLNSPPGLSSSQEGPSPKNPGLFIKNYHTKVVEVEHAPGLAPYNNSNHPTNSSSIGVTRHHPYQQIQASSSGNPSYTATKTFEQLVGNRSEPTNPWTQYNSHNLSQPAPSAAYYTGYSPQSFYPESSAINTYGGSQRTQVQTHYGYSLSPHNPYVGTGSSYSSNGAYHPGSLSQGSHNGRHRYQNNYP